MKLKEAFRYQNFLDSMMTSACDDIASGTRAMATTKIHQRSKANPGVEDEVETVQSDVEYTYDHVIKLIKQLVEEREKLSNAIYEAKRYLAYGGVYVDPCVETNKFRQRGAQAIRRLLHNKPSTYTTKGQSYNFDVNGVQVPYVHDVVIETKDNFDREVTKSVMRSLQTEADSVSMEVESAMVTTDVEYSPVYDVNMTYEEILEVISKL